MTDPTILILMSAYNGALYIREQLESIFRQEDVKVSLLVRDDGSTDSTVEIIKEFRDMYPDSIILEEGKNIGWKKSFFQLVAKAAERYSSYDYFAFADQDDIWLPRKLRSAVDILSGHEAEPSLYCSNLIYYKDGVKGGLYRQHSVVPTYHNCVVRNYATGCTVVFNRCMLRLAASSLPAIDMPHDYWLYLLATFCGYAYVDSESHILYRQHGNNQIGCDNGIVSVWRRRLRELKTAKDKHPKEDMAKELLRMLAPYLNDEAADVLGTVANYRNSWRCRLKLLLSRKFTYNSMGNDFWMKVKVLTGRF